LELKSEQSITFGSGIADSHPEVAQRCFIVG
jgi:hypothetical protein